MAEETNAGVTVFVAEVASMCGLWSDGIAALLSACWLVHCYSQQFIFPCPELFFQCVFMHGLFSLDCNERTSERACGISRAWLQLVSFDNF